jgi:membrane dipeptidase
MILIDAHLDLSMNALNWDRDLQLEVHELRRREAGMTQKGRARGTTTLPEMRKGEVALSLATVICRVAWPGSPATGAANQQIAYSKAQGQLAYYRILESQGKLRQVRDQAGLAAHMQAWQDTPETTPLGYILSMEGADPIVDAGQVTSWWEDGLRVVSLSHYGFSAYAHGTDTVGGLTERGRPLLEAMAAAGMIVDLTHLADEAFFETLDAFSGPVLASHNNCRALVPGCRQFTDEQIAAIIARGGVIGAALDAWMIYPGWIKGETQPEVVSLDNLVDHIVHICELAGDADHVGIGSDLDGGYGNEQTPHDLGTIADLQKLAPLLSRRGFSDDDVERFMRGNWIRFFSQHLPA